MYVIRRLYKQCIRHVTVQQTSEENINQLVYQKGGKLKVEIKAAFKAILTTGN